MQSISKWKRSFSLNNSGKSEVDVDENDHTFRNKTLYGYRIISMSYLQ